MKKLFTLAMIALAFAACQEKPEPDKPGGNGNGNETPIDNPTAGGYDEITVVLKAANLKTAWAAGDEIRVYGVTAAGADVEAAYVLKDGAGSATGKFAPAAGETALEKGGKDYFAAYPNDPDRTFAQHNTFTAVLPAEQTEPAPLFAHATDAATLELASFVGAIKFPFTASGKATAAGNRDGFIKVVFDAKTGDWLGCHMVGDNVTEMVAAAVLCRELGAKGEDIIHAVFPHPTMSEGIMEAAAAAYNECVHL